MTPYVSVIIPTQGRPTIARTLASIRSQIQKDEAVEIVIVQDRYEPDRPGRNYDSFIDLRVQQLAEEFRARVVQHDAGHNCWGHCQINHGISQATGDYVSFMDDDDIFAPGAFDAIGRGIALCPRSPLLFQFHTHWGEVLWDRPVAQQGRIGGHCLVTPRNERYLGKWSCRYEGDYDFIESTLKLYPPSAVAWIPRLIAIARPD